MCYDFGCFGIGGYEFYEVGVFDGVECVDYVGYDCFIGVLIEGLLILLCF